MKLCVLENLYAGLPFEESLSRLAALGVEALEIGAGGYPGKAHCNPAELLADKAALAKFKKTVADHGMPIAALAAHGNPVHPNAEMAKSFDTDFREAVLLAEELEVDTIVTFSGCPGDHPGAKYPNWVTCPWPEDFLAVLDYQWNDVILPYWKDAGEFARQHGVRVAFEMHPGFCVYNTETMLRIRREIGPVLGANLDPSHLVWQGVDIVTAIRELGDAIHHFHAKDTRIDPANTAAHGVLDCKHYSDEINRSWVFRTVGYGHGEDFWREIVTALRLVGYDRVMSIEHEDSLLSIDEGLAKAVAFLKPLLLSTPKPGKMAWA